MAFVSDQYIHGDAHTIYPYLCPCTSPSSDHLYSLYLTIYSDITINKIYFAVLQMAEETKNLREIFDSFDSDKNGTIQIKEIEKVAEQVGEPCSAQELSEIMELLDINKDGKVSFEEFEYWWSKRKNDKMMMLVWLKAKAMKMNNFIKNKFNEANITLDPTIKPKPDIFDFLVSFGEQYEQGIKINIGFNIQGEQHKKKFEEAKKLSPTIEEDSLGMVFKIPAENPAFVKTAIDEIVNEIITMPGFPIPIQSLEDNPFFYYSSQVCDGFLTVTILTKNQINGAVQPSQAQAKKVVEGLGQAFYGLSCLELTINSTVEDILEKPIHENLLRGFSFNFKAQSNNSALKKVRKLLENQGMPGILNLFTLIRGTKFHWKLKTPKQVDSFMNKLGISEAVADLPVLSELLEQMGAELRQHKQQASHPLMILIKKLGRIALHHGDNNVQIYKLAGKTGITRVNIDAKGISKVYAILFDEF